MLTESLCFTFYKNKKYIGNVVGADRTNIERTLSTL